MCNLILSERSANATNKDKSSANGEKSAGDNKVGKSEDKPSADGKESANHNGGDPDNKFSANIKSLFGEKNINQDGNAGVQEQEEAKVAGAVI